MSRFTLVSLGQSSFCIQFHLFCVCAFDAIRFLVAETVAKFCKTKITLIQNKSHIQRFTLSFWLFNHFHRGLMPVHTTTPTMTRHTFTTNHSNNPMLSSPLFPRRSLDTAPTVPVSPRFTRRPFPNKASPGL